MGKGIMFHIVSEDMICEYTEISADNFCDYAESMGVERFIDQHPENAKESVAWLASRLQKAGFKIKTSSPELGGFVLFHTGSETETTACKAQYFAAAFAEVKKRVNEMSVETFASDGPEEYLLRTLIRNDSDMVYFGGQWEDTYYLDSFIRKLQPDKGYYICPETVYMS